MNEITYHVELADLRAFQRHYRRVSPFARRIRLFTVLLIVGLNLHSTIRHIEGSDAFRVAFFLITTGLVLGVMFTISFAFNRLAESWAFRDGARHGILGEHTITLTAAGLHERTAVNDSMSAWRGILRIDTTPEHIFIFMQPNMAHIIPRSAFSSDADADWFAATARSYHEAALERA